MVSGLGVNLYMFESRGTARCVHKLNLGQAKRLAG
jgi:hypothetical protein